MSYGVGLRNGVAFALGTIPSLTSGGGLRPSLLLNFLSGTLDSRITFSRGTQATQYTSNGTLQYAPNNLLTYSNQADNAAWTKSNSFVQTNLLTFSDAAVANYSLTSGTVVNTTPISGFTNSVRFPDNSATIVAYKTYTVVINTLYTISAYVQMDDNSAPVLSSSAFSGDLTLVVDSNPAPLNLTVTSVGSGVYRVSASYTTAAFTGTNIGVVKYNTQSAKGFKVTGLQLVQGSVPGNYQATTSAALPVLYADYNGVVRARKLCEDSILTTHEAKQDVVTLAAQYTFSAYLKAGERTFAMFYHGNSNSAQVIDLTTGAASGNAGLGAPLSYAIVNAGNGWWRLSITVAATTAINNFRIYPLSNSTTYNYTGNGSSGIYIADAQLEAGSTVQAYNDTTSAAYYGPRFDYEPVTKVLRGLLIEELRTNLLLQSNDFQTSWTPTNITRTLASTTGPDGTLSGVKIEATATAATVDSQLQIVNATSATYSIFVKQGSSATAANNFVLRNQTTLTNLVDTSLNYSTGALTTSGVGTATATNIGNGWWRLQLTSTTGITSGDSINVYAGFIGGTPTAGTFLYAYGAQLEAGAFATSYIPTVGSQVTRSADSASVNTLTPWFNASAGTLVTSYQSAASIGQDIAMFTAGAPLTASLGMYAISNDTTIAGWSRVGGVTQANPTSSVVTAKALHKTAFAYAANDFAISSNNGTVGTTSSGSLPTVDRLIFGASGIAGTSMAMWLNSVSFYPTRLPNATLQGLTV